MVRVPLPVVPDVVDPGQSGDAAGPAIQEARPNGTANPDDDICLLAYSMHGQKSRVKAGCPRSESINVLAKENAITSRTAWCWHSRRVLPTFASMGDRSSSCSMLDPMATCSASRVRTVNDWSP